MEEIASISFLTQKKSESIFKVFVVILLTKLKQDVNYLTLGVSICLDVVSIETLDLDVVKE